MSTTKEQRPTYDEVLAKVRACLDEAKGWLNSGWEPRDVTGDQFEALGDARRFIGLAKDKIEEAGRS